jgi:chromosome segregation ATPase
MIWIVAAGLYRQGYGSIAAAFCILSLPPWVWYRQQRARTRDLERQSTLCSDRLASCLMEVRKTEAEARQVEAEIRKLTGQDEINQADVDARVAEVERLSRLTDEIRRMDENLATAGIEIERLVRQIEEARSNLQSLLREASAVGEDDFLQRAEIYKQRQHLIHELDKIPLESPEPGMLFDMRAEEDAAYETALREVAEIEARLAAARHEAGRVWADQRI